ncbi:cellulose synthase operon protein YhjQ [Pusillimonas sp. MFBS29]|uniref:cellulose biosynthesis protein BcsQ n=1 Tax=Pusillimonas sp. MFBS29 TaxID=2886690 RepID=UPI001D11D68C|nr:cellulose biosynthesis protein BcsQ [Pusillimonas sp. MFBS29]MCC2596005.1 cellulose synthase operon protein YhjQ [Pusillimonas sp. MFBS29]
MKVVAVVSAKGGVGKSTVSANLSAALQAQGYPVIAVDLDPQNGLRYHFSLHQSTGLGLSGTIHGTPLSDIIRPTEAGVALLPYGECTEQERQDFEAELRHNKRWLSEKLHGMSLADDVMVVIDTPPGPSVYLSQALTAASLAVVVVLPDAGSYATLPQMRSLIETYCLGRPDFIDYGLLINQVEQAHQLGKDITQVLRTTFDERVVGLVHTDQALSEALAYGQNIFQYRSYSEGARDMQACGQWVLRRLGL